MFEKYKLQIIVLKVYFKVLLHVQKVTCPIHNVTIHTFIWATKGIGGKYRRFSNVEFNSENNFFTVEDF